MLYIIWGVIFHLIIQKSFYKFSFLSFSILSVETLALGILSITNAASPLAARLSQKNKMIEFYEE